MTNAHRCFSWEISYVAVESSRVTRFYFASLHSIDDVNCVRLLPKKESGWCGSLRHTERRGLREQERPFVHIQVKVGSDNVAESNELPSVC